MKKHNQSNKKPICTKLTIIYCTNDKPNYKVNNIIIDEELFDVPLTPTKKKIKSHCVYCNWFI